MVRVLFLLAVSVVPLLTLLAKNPLFVIITEIIGLVLFEINLLAIVAELLILKCPRTNVTQPRVFAAVDLPASPAVLWAERKDA